MIDFATLARPQTPNAYLLVSEGACGEAATDGPAPTFDADPDGVFAAAEAVARGMDRVSEVETDAGSRALSFTQRTELMRFKDDVDVRVVPDGTGAALMIYSRSRVGQSDLGANEKRVTAFVGAVRERLA